MKNKMNLEKDKIKEFFITKILQSTNSLFENYFDSFDPDCFVLLTEELLNDLDGVFEKSELKEHFSYAIGQVIYVSIFCGESVFPLEDIEKMKLGELVDTGEDIIYEEGAEYDGDLHFYTIKSIENIIENTMGKDGFKGILDFNDCIDIVLFEEIYIYSALKILNKFKNQKRTEKR